MRFIIAALASFAVFSSSPVLAARPLHLNCFVIYRTTESQAGQYSVRIDIEPISEASAALTIRDLPKNSFSMLSYKNCESGQCTAEVRPNDFVLFRIADQHGQGVIVLTNNGFLKGTYLAKSQKWGFEENGGCAER